MNLLGGRVTTLCFHGIGTPDRELEPGEQRFWITPEQFDDILDVVAEHPSPIEITFDDANASDHTYGLAALTQRGLSAEFFVIAGRLDQRGSLSGSQVREIHAAGMPIGNHGLRHLSWREVTDDRDLEEEVGGAEKVIESVVGVPPEHAACPRGSYDRRVLTLLKRHRYTRVLTVDEGTSAPGAWLRNRYTLIHSDTPESVAARLDRPDGALRDHLTRSTKQVLKRWR